MGLRVQVVGTVTSIIVSTVYDYVVRCYNDNVLRRLEAAIQTLVLLL